MLWRLLLFLFVTMLAVFATVKGFRLPIDGLLAFFVILMPLVMAIFAHYRYVGRLRTSGKFSRALRHLLFWRLLLPRDAYLQLRIQILIESGDIDAAKAAIDKAESQGLDFAYIGGFRADLSRRQGHYRHAKDHLEHTLDITPPGLLRAGLLTQLARLYAVFFTTEENLERAEELLLEAEEFIKGPPHEQLIRVVRGELRLAQEEYEEAEEMLRSSLDYLLKDDDGSFDPEAKKPQRSISQRLMQLFAWLTYSQNDEHQHPFYAELCLSLGKVYEKLSKHEVARRCFERGLELSQQAFVARSLEKALG